MLFCHFIVTWLGAWAFSWFLIASMTKWAMLWNIRHCLVYPEIRSYGFFLINHTPSDVTLVWVTGAQADRLVLADVGKVAMKTSEVMGIVTKVWKMVRSSTVRLGNVHCGKMKVSIIFGKKCWQFWKTACLNLRLLIPISCRMGILCSTP